MVDLGSIPAFSVDLFPGRIIPVTKKLVLDSSGYPARHLALQSQSWDWLAWCHFAVTGWGRKFDLRLLSQCGSTSSCVGRSISEIHYQCGSTSSCVGRSISEIHYQCGSTSSCVGRSTPEIHYQCGSTSSCVSRSTPEIHYQCGSTSSCVGRSISEIHYQCGSTSSCVGRSISEIHYQCGSTSSCVGRSTPEIHYQCGSTSSCVSRSTPEIHYQCGSTSSCVSRSTPEIHYHVAGMSSNQPTTTHLHSDTVDGWGLHGRGALGAEQVRLPGGPLPCLPDAADRGQDNEGQDDHPRSHTTSDEWNVDFSFQIVDCKNTQRTGACMMMGLGKIESSAEEGVGVWWNEDDGDRGDAERGEDDDSKDDADMGGGRKFEAVCWKTKGYGYIWIQNQTNKISAEKQTNKPMNRQTDKMVSEKNPLVYCMLGVSLICEHKDKDLGSAILFYS